MNELIESMGRTAICVLSGLQMLGCFNPVYPEGLPCGPERWCPSGQSCSAANLCVGQNGIAGDAGNPLVDADPVSPTIDAASGPDARRAACLSDEGYTPHSNTGNSYKLIQGVLYWADARAACEAEGARLVVIENADENGFIKAMVENNAPSNAWIGSSDQLTEGTFVWVDGQPLGTAQWAPGAPDNETDIDAAGEHCVFMVAGGDDGGKWNDAPCMHDYYRLRSVCECDDGAVDTD